MYDRVLPAYRFAAWLLSFALLACTSSSDFALDKVVDGVRIYLGVVPAEIVRGHPKEHPEGQMHDGAPAGSGQYHVMVALFDAKTGQRIDVAEVTAKVAGVEKKLEVMNIANAITYGNFFPMSGRGPSHIVVQIRKPGEPRVVEAQFAYKQE